MKDLKVTHQNLPLPDTLKRLERPARQNAGRSCAAIYLAGRLVFFTVVGLAVAPSAQAICTPNIPGNVACLADQPIQSAVSIKPNIMFILDNSGSMAWDIMNTQTATSNVESGSNPDTRLKACRKNFNYNPLYYNPNINYTALVPKRPDPSTGAIVSMPSQTWPNAQTDPFTSTATVNLSTGFLPVDGSTTSPQNNAQAAYYYKYTYSAPLGTACDTNDAHFTKVVVSSTSCVVSGDVTSCPTGADERVNFANWFSYFSTRINMMKSGMATAFSTIDDKFRVGFHTINNPSASGSTGGSLNIQDFSGGATGTPKGNWYAKLFQMVPGGGTPLQDALARVGNYYRGSGTMTGLSGDPVQYSCQKNYAILSTDGYWNSSSVSVGNMDRTVPASMPIKDGNSAYVAGDTGLTQGAAFPRPFIEGATASSNSLSDVAMYYWINDLRTSGAVSANNVPTTPSDPAYWQHMTTFTVGLGVDGQLDFPTNITGLRSGALSWPTPVADTATAVDDLWHAAINGHGQYFRATDPTTLANGLTGALRAITDAPSAGVGPSSSTNDYKSADQTDLTTYVSSYRLINWSGDVEKYNTDPVTGLRTGTALWSAAYQLDSKVNPGLTETVSTTAFTTRNIVTRQENGTVIPFDYASLSATQRTALCYKATPTGPCVAGDTSLVDYLRGDARYEGDYGETGKRFRNRQDTTEFDYYKRDLIGTIVNSQPAYVAAEDRKYSETGFPGYTAFAATTRNRVPMLYVPANDGMVHALNANTGDEVWAYIPSFLIPTATDEVGYEKGLRALSYQDGGAPPYNQHYYIDAVPIVAAVDFGHTGTPTPTTSPDWHNILVGGLGKGGKGYYALDVTVPALPNNMASARSKVLWEFPSAADPTHAAVISGGKMGYSFGTPIVAKTPAWGWVVIVASGFNNTDPSRLGYIFVLNARTGALLETLQTTVAAPGLAYVTSLVKSGDETVHGVYSGDLNGTLWRFDFDVPAFTNAATGTQQRVWRLFTSSSATPIGSEVDVEVDKNTGYRWVFFGTGQYLDVPDRSTTGGQYLVGLKDGYAPDAGDQKPNITGVPAQFSTLSTVTNLMSGVTAPTTGWKYLLPNSGERVSIKPVADLSTALFVSLIPTTNPCSPGSSSYLYGLNYSTGKTRLQDTNGNLMANYYVPAGAAGASIIMTGKTATSNGSPGIQITTHEGQTLGAGVAPQLDTSLIPAGTRHVGWREVADDN